ncbi:MAG: hypothetical protein AAB855_00865, partial [Patescibacteria group bacterium]
MDQFIDVNLNFDPGLINIANPSWDTLLVLIFIIATLIYSFFSNRERLGVVLLSVYTAIAIYYATPLLHNYVNALDPVAGIPYRIGIFVALFISLFTLLSSHLSLRSDGDNSWLNGLLLSFLQVGLLISTTVSLIPPDVFSTQFVRSFFTDDIPRSAW